MYAAGLGQEAEDHPVPGRPSSSLRMLHIFINWPMDEQAYEAEEPKRHIWPLFAKKKKANRCLHELLGWHELLVLKPPFSWCYTHATAVSHFKTCKLIWRWSHGSPAEHGLWVQFFFFLMLEWMAANFGGATHALFDMCRPTSAAFEFKRGTKYHFSPKLTKKNQDVCWFYVSVLVGVATVHTRGSNERQSNDHHVQRG